MTVGGLISYISCCTCGTWLRFGNPQQHFHFLRKRSFFPAWSSWWRPELRSAKGGTSLQSSNRRGTIVKVPTYRKSFFINSTRRGFLSALPVAIYRDHQELVWSNSKLVPENLLMQTEIQALAETLQHKSLKAPIAQPIRPSWQRLAGPQTGPFGPIFAVELTESF
jgi:hypothetical protein